MFALLDVAESTGAGLVTAVATVITAVGGLILAVSVLIPILRGVREVHTIVNQQRTDLVRFQAALVRQLKAAGIEPVIDQSLPIEPEVVAGESPTQHSGL